MRRAAIILNIFFILLFVICLILSLLISWLFFVPIICFLPFVFRGKDRIKESLIDLKKSPQEALKEKDIGFKLRYCPACGGEIKEPIAKFCYHCGSKLNND